MWWLGQVPGTSARGTSALNCWAISAVAGFLSGSLHLIVLLVFKIFFKLLYVLILWGMFMCAHLPWFMWVCARVMAHVVVRGHSTGASFSPTRGFQGLNSGHQTWWHLHSLSHFAGPRPSSLNLLFILFYYYLFSYKYLEYILSPIF